MADFVDEDDEVIDAEAEIRPRAFVFPSLGKIFELYGWYILLVFLIALFIYNKYIAPFLKSIAERKELEQRKKFDADVYAANEQRIQEARLRLQAKLDADAAAFKEAQKRKEQEALEKAMKDYGIKDDGKTLQSSSKTSNASASASSSSSSVGDKFDAKTFIMNKINSMPVVVFSNSSCVFSRRTKQALSTFRLPTEFYDIIEIDLIANGERIQDALLSISGTRSIPRVFIGGQCIGGCDEILNALKDGSLKRILQETGVI